MTQRLSSRQLRALTVLASRDARPTRFATSDTEVNNQTFDALSSAGLARLARDDAGKILFQITPQGLDTLRDEEDRRAASKAYGSPGRGRGAFRPAGSLCRHCEYRPARPHPQHPELATDYCGDACARNHRGQREREAQREAAEAIRRLMGLPGGRGPTFTAPELQAIERRLRRVLPYDGLTMRKASTRRRQGVA